MKKHYMPPLADCYEVMEENMLDGSVLQEVGSQKTQQTGINPNSNDLFGGEFCSKVIGGDFDSDWE